uniref:T cell receptor delta n=1 Tax=Mus musculus TaxID=10090 RepID=UPI00005051A1|nr:Chain E, T cell receptor delta [Mus musculus]1YPZ_G Chain G, T cell receptor delta [Mus musculus]
GDQVEQSPSALSLHEGTDSALRCNFTTTMRSVQWFRQNSRGSLISLFYLASGTKENGRLKSAFDSKERRYSTLHIRDAQLEDSGTYFCAADTWHISEGYELGTDKLVFGQGTQVTVEPKSQPPAKPSVFIMKNGTNVACLVKDFYPKEVTISLRSSKKIVEFDPAIVISPSGKYSAVKLGQYGDSNSVTCSVQHNSETVHSTDFEAA